MPLEFCQHQDVVFERAPLIRVLSQIRFPPVLSLLTVAGVTGFQTAIRERYPTMLPVESTTEVTPEPNAETQAPVWRFTDEERQWTVGLAVNFVSLETPSYSHIGEFLERFQYILSALHRTVRPADSRRIGLRKVNMFEVAGRDTTALVGVVRRELLGPLGTETFPAPIAGYFSNLMFADEDNALVVRHGLAEDDKGNSGDVTKFVVDLDYFTERPQEVDGTEAVIGLLRHFSDGMTSFFHWAVEDDYKIELGPRDRDLDARGVQ